MLTIYLDFKSPAAYLALPPTIVLIEEYQLTVSWRPYKTNQEAIPAEEANETRGYTHRRVRAIARQRTHLLYAHTQNIPMVFPDEPGETDLALTVLAALTEPAENFIQAAFAAYWQRGEDLNQPAVVEMLLSRCGLDSKLAHTQDSVQQIQALQKSGRDHGVVDTPAYVIGDQVFVGREHLPWIRELLNQSFTSDPARG